MAETGQVFDMNKPPVRVSNPGQTGTGYRPFPRHLHRVDGTYLAVESEAAQAAAVADGWFLTQDEANAAALSIKRGPGRPRAGGEGTA